MHKQEIYIRQIFRMCAAHDKLALPVLKRPVITEAMKPRKVDTTCRAVGYLYMLGASHINSPIIKKRCSKLQS